jgi:hypothetical protein
MTEKTDEKYLPGMPDVETRYLKTEVRAAEAEGKPMIEGLAAVFDQETVIGNWFREKIKPGAFDEVLGKNPDVVAAWNHNWEIVLGRTLSGTLKLASRDDGLHYSILINSEDRGAMDKYSIVKRGDVFQSSFAFYVKSEEWEYPPEGSTELPLRIITEIEQLFDVSPVTFPGYATTTAAVRSKSIKDQQSHSEENQVVPPEESPAQDPQVRNDLLRKRLDLIEKE